MLGLLLGFLNIILHIISVVVLVFLYITNIYMLHCLKNVYNLSLLPLFIYHHQYQCVIISNNNLIFILYDLWLIVSIVCVILNIRYTSFTHSFSSFLSPFPSFCLPSLNFKLYNYAMCFLTFSPLLFRFRFILEV